MGEAVELSDVAWERLHEVCLRGMCSVPTDDESAALIAAGLVRAAPGGLAALPAGRTALSDWACLPEGSEAHGAVHEAYIAFVSLDSEMEQVVSEWQEQGASRQQHLDHHAKRVLAQLRATHAGLEPVLSVLGHKVPRFARYGARLEGALTEIDAGRHEYLAGIMVDSYHTVWWHLHQDLAWALGVTGPGSSFLTESTR